MIIFNHYGGKNNDCGMQPTIYDCKCTFIGNRGRKGTKVGTF